MSVNKVVPTAAAGAATLPVTGSPTIAILATAAALMVGGLLLIRASRLRKNNG